ncbi:hypothetical protein AB9M62_21575 [Bacillales bacterium AN1005]
MNTIIDQELWVSIDSYIDTNYLAAEKKEEAYVLDNNVMTHLATSARNHPTDFECMLESLNIRKYDVIIPSIILEESAGNTWMTKEKYEELYLPFFQTLSNFTKVYILTVSDVLNVIADGDSNASSAFDTFQLIAQKLNKANIDIQIALKDATTDSHIENALRINSDDAGERVAHLVICSLLMNGLETVTFLSDEEKQVFNTRIIVSSDETLLEIMRMPSQNIFLQSYLLNSFDCILYETMRNYRTWSLVEKKEFIRRNRNGSAINRNVRYQLSDSTFDRSQLGNDEFASLVHDNPASRILF